MGLFHWMEPCSNVVFIVLRRSLSFILFFVVFYIVERFPDVSWVMVRPKSTPFRWWIKRVTSGKARTDVVGLGDTISGGTGPHLLLVVGERRKLRLTLSFHHYLDSERM